MIVGLVGKSCSGKNYVGRILEGMGLLVWDTDVMCHDGLLENLDAVVKAFGPEVVSIVNGQTIVSRKAIGKVVFSDPGKRTELEGILYPWLMAKVLEWRDMNPDGVLVLNGALLHRGGFHLLCDCVIYVDASYEVRRDRAILRDGITEAQFRQREDSQSDVDFRDVDYVVPVHVVPNNEANFEGVNRQVFNICDKLGILKAKL
ncbi:MAG: dephospho-CoA kinase [Spirochaetales bacterium]|nr:dephospho-CoA kinase [Spirochaetales bacterium]